jgi:hypothetical protein
MTHFLTVIICMAILQFFQCTTNALNGGGSEITGCVVTTDAAPASNVKVSLIDSDAGYTFLDTTDLNGNYSFSGYGEIPHGVYTLQGSKDSLAFIDFNVLYDASYTKRTDTLKSTGCIYALVTLENSRYQQGADVYIPGTSFMGKTDDSGAVMLSFIPQGNYEVRFEKHGFKVHCGNVSVLPGTIDTIGPVTLSRDLSVAAEIPVPTSLKAQIDTTFGIVNLTWDSIIHDVDAYNIRIINPAIHHHPIEGIVCFTQGATFSDTLYSGPDIDSATIKWRIYQVRVIGINGNEGQWGRLCTLSIRRPVVPPSPQCSLTYIPGSMIVNIRTIVPMWWWTDSVFIYRTVYGCEPFCIAARRTIDSSLLIDNIRSVPVPSDSTISLTYTVFTKSVFGFYSQSSPITLNSTNPIFNYSIKATGKPWGPEDVVDAGTYQIRVGPVYSPLKDDTVEYRLIVSSNIDSELSFTNWYAIPSIEVMLSNEAVYSIKNQVRSHHFPGLESTFSDALTVVVHQLHSIPKPSTPTGAIQAICSIPYYYNVISDGTCTYNHPVKIRYEVAYQGEAVSDSTSWLSASDNVATIIWSKPGIAYLRAQLRCTVDSLLFSPWSDALVVTVGNK